MIIFGSPNIHSVFIRPPSSELRCLVTESSPEMRYLLVNIMAGPGIRMHVSGDEVLCGLLQDNECSCDYDMNMKILSHIRQNLSLVMKIDNSDAAWYMD
jgi:hypothetical protein